jgi:hypothetical protein
MSARKFQKPRTTNRHAKSREKKLGREIEKLMDIRDESEFLAALTNILELHPGCLEYDEALKLWRDAQ